MSLALAADSLHASAAASAVASVFASKGQAITVDIDGTVFVQVALFIVLLLILKPVLFDPMLKLFEEREKRILGAKVQARKLDEGAVGALTKYETEMQHARAAGNSERDKLRAEGVKTENELLAKVRASTAETLETGRKRLAEEVVSARATLTADAGALARDLASRVLGRQVQP
jgi:F-type H+-transporting ATPase subunit b